MNGQESPVTMDPNDYRYLAAYFPGGGGVWDAQRKPWPWNNPIVMGSPLWNQPLNYIGVGPLGRANDLDLSHVPQVQYDGSKVVPYLLKFPPILPIFH